MTPADAATGVSVLQPVTVTAQAGELTQVSLTNTEGKLVAGALSPDQRTWISSEPLGYARSYQLAATAVDAAGLSTTSSSSFPPCSRRG
ncbi:hypothetical protein GCM10011594_44210 [Nakamurella endophytica]|uniref:Bacterial Ig domain-containing protein n=1 Tax=Nakamurella endophytica TaxID=1748367 RepID=A0A917TDX0_9ACTN|nr:hypothetical protein GCM10011594_44210 [Nakamurella endophytica]